MRILPKKFYLLNHWIKKRVQNKNQTPEAIRAEISKLIANSGVFTPEEIESIQTIIGA